MEKLTKAWLSCWLYVIALISGIVLGATICSWAVWPLQTKLFALATALLPIRVLEEWRFPGGFHTMYNWMAGSGRADRYPMNQLSDMWTNLIGILFGCAVLAVGVTPLFAVMQLVLCLAEICGHIRGGIFVKKRCRAQGKRTLYNPGLFTTVFGYLPLAVGFLSSFFTGQAPTLPEAALALVFGALLGAIALPGMERLCKSKDTPYRYTWGDGYFEKYGNLH